MDSAGALPLASLSLHALAAPAPAAARAPRPAGAAAGPRSYPLAPAAPARPVVPSASSAPPAARPAAPRRHPLLRLAAAVPAALGRLVAAPASAKYHAPPLVSTPRLSDVRIFPSAVPRRAARGGSGRPAAAGGRRAAIVWFRNDLRLHDNPALAAACGEGSSVLPVYVFDPREYGKTASGFARTGPARAQFVLEAVADLRARLRAAGSDLIVRRGRAEDVLAGLAKEVGAAAVYCQAEVTAEEAQVEGRVRAALERSGAELRASWGGTLFHPDDLPFSLSSMPTTYADFRARVSRLAVRPAAESEGGVKGLPLGRVEPGEIPTPQQLGVAAPPRPAAAAAGGGSGSGLAPLPGAPPVRGGEGEALRHLQAFIRELKASASRPVPSPPASPASTPASTPAPTPASAFSCRISPWLALGCLSPRRMFHELQRQLAGSGSGSGGVGPVQIAGPAAATGGARAAAAGGGGGGGGGHANWLVFELLWRDFFRFVTHKYTAATAAGGAKGRAAAPALAAA